jgi:hypothetical protein
MSQQRKCSQELRLAAKPSRRIVLAIDRDHYQAVIQDAGAFRCWIETKRRQYPELFPDEIREGSSLHDIRRSRKLPDVYIRRIRLNRSGTVHRVVSSFVLPYMTGYTDGVEKALFLRHFGVPFWGLSYVFGHNDMYWYRLVEDLGRFDVVGTTVKASDQLPEHLLPDEKFTSLNGNEVYVATTVGNDVVLGANIALSVQTDPLKQAYNDFKQEALRLQPNYAPKTLTLDGWRQTKEAWLRLFPTLILIRCFLHAFLRIRDRCKNYAVYPALCAHFWHIYRAKTYMTYWRRFRVFLAFADQHLSGEAFKAVRKFEQKRAELFIGWRHPVCHRVSTMLERHMQPTTRCLYMGRDFHGHRVSAHLLVRGRCCITFNPTVHAPACDLDHLSGRRSTSSTASPIGLAGWKICSLRLLLKSSMTTKSGRTSHFSYADIHTLMLDDGNRPTKHSTGFLPAPLCSGSADSLHFSFRLTMGGYPKI